MTDDTKKFVCKDGTCGTCEGEACTNTCEHGHTCGSGECKDENKKCDCGNSECDECNKK